MLRSKILVLIFGLALVTAACAEQAAESDADGAEPVVTTTVAPDAAVTTTVAPDEGTAHDDDAGAAGEFDRASRSS